MFIAGNSISHNIYFRSLFSCDYVRSNAVSLVGGRVKVGDLGGRPGVLVAIGNVCSDCSVASKGAVCVFIAVFNGLGVGISGAGTIEGSISG